MGRNSWESISPLWREGALNEINLLALQTGIHKISLIEAVVLFVVSVGDFSVCVSVWNGWKFPKTYSPGQKLTTIALVGLLNWRKDYLMAFQARSDGHRNKGKWFDTSWYCLVKSQQQFLVQSCATQLLAVPPCQSDFNNMLYIRFIWSTVKELCSWGLRSIKILLKLNFARQQEVFLDVIHGRISTCFKRDRGLSRMYF